jgi:hypothetical protein
MTRFYTESCPEKNERFQGDTAWPIQAVPSKRPYPDILSGRLTAEGPLIEGRIDALFIG